MTYRFLTIFILATICQTPRFSYIFLIISIIIDLEILYFMFLDWTWLSLHELFFQKSL